jgi:L-aminopeptidase/D-esterase-like protein
VKLVAAALIVVCVALAGMAQHASQAPSTSPAAQKGLTAIPGLKVGHHTLTERPTGCTVVLAEAGAVAGVDVRGGAPGSVETALLDPFSSAERIHGLVLSGGSTFGLESRTGVMDYLEERKVGIQFGGFTIPLVPGAILFDLRIGDAKIRPGRDCGYAAAKAASDAPVAEGNVGAGAGATIGKLDGPKYAMKAGIGSSEIRLQDGVIVAALVAVNAVGDVVDPSTGKVIAGRRTDDGKGLLDVRTVLRSRPAMREAQAGGNGDFALNTTLGIVATNARLTKLQANRVAQIAHNGFARAIVPVHTSNDGDAIFALATGELAGTPNVDVIAWAASEAIAEAIVRAVRAATSIPGYPAARDLK